MNKAIIVIGGVFLVVGIFGINCEYWHPFAICLGAGIGLIIGTLLCWMIWD